MAEIGFEAFTQGLLLQDEVARMDARRRWPAAGLRSVFLSDTHLGSPYSQAEPLLSFLNSIEPEYLYLVGDIIDGWRLKQRWHWKPTFSRVLTRLLVMGQSGTQICFTPGNHDAFLRDFAHDFGFAKVSESFVHECADGRAFLVLHGDQFDDFEKRAPWLSFLGSAAYDSLLWIDSQFNRGRRALGLKPIYFSSRIKKRCKRAVTFVSDFQRSVERYALALRCDGVICGHIHTPAAIESHSFTYFNTGDWVEDRTAILEYYDGSMALIHFPDEAETRQPAAAVPTGLSQSLVVAGCSVPRIPSSYC